MIGVATSPKFSMAPTHSLRVHCFGRQYRGRGGGEGVQLPYVSISQIYSITFQQIDVDEPFRGYLHWRCSHLKKIRNLIIIFIHSSIWYFLPGSIKWDIWAFISPKYHVTAEYKIEDPRSGSCTFLASKITNLFKLIQVRMYFMLICVRSFLKEEW